jgi:hypothetical protein
MNDHNHQALWYFSFGLAHPLAKTIIVISGTEESSREQMIAVYGTNWAFQYTQAEGERLMEKYSLQPQSLPT